MDKIKPGERYLAVVDWARVGVEVLATRADVKRPRWSGTGWVEEIKPHGVQIRVVEPPPSGGPARGSEKVVTAREILMPWEECLQRRAQDAERQRLAREEHARAQQVAQERTQSIEVRLRRLGWDGVPEWLPRAGQGIPSHLSLSLDQLEQLLDQLEHRADEPGGLNALL